MSLNPPPVNERIRRFATDPVPPELETGWCVQVRCVLYAMMWIDLPGIYTPCYAAAVAYKTELDIQNPHIESRVVPYKASNDHSARVN